MIDVLIPESVEEAIDIFDTVRAKCKFRAVIIENIGQFLKCARTSLTGDGMIRGYAELDVIDAAAWSGYDSVLLRRRMKSKS